MEAAAAASLLPPEKEEKQTTERERERESPGIVIALSVCPLVSLIFLPQTKPLIAKCLGFHI